MKVRHEGAQIEFKELLQERISNLEVRGIHADIFTYPSEAVVYLKCTSIGGHLITAKGSGLNLWAALDQAETQLFSIN